MFTRLVTLMTFMGLVLTGAVDAQDKKACLTIKDFDSKVVEHDSVGNVYMAWKVVIQNTCRKEFTLGVRFRWFDSQDFEVARAVNWPETIPAQSTHTVTSRYPLTTTEASAVTKHGVSLH